MVLKEFRTIRGVLVCKTGLHIGAGKDTIEIGGVDAPIVKHPITQEPYIPGSSLKGRMRSLFEKRLNKFSDRDPHEPCNCGRTDCIVCKLFGAHKKPSSEVAPTRVIVRDAYLTKETREQFQKMLTEKGKSFLEIKAENMVDRQTGVATNPRFIERIPAGAAFNFEIVIQVFDNDNSEELESKVKECLSLVEQTYLGGSGSRGYGQVGFTLEPTAVVRF